MTPSKSPNFQGITRKHLRALSIITVLFVPLALGGSYFVQSNRSRRPVITNVDKGIPLDVSGVYKVKEIRFDPMAAGRNRASIMLRNLTNQSQRAGIRIQTQTLRAGWGSSHFGCVLAPLEERWYNFHFTIRDDFVNKTWIHLRFSNPPSKGVYQDIRFYGSELERRKPDTDISLPVTPEVATVITSRFQEFQDMLRHKRYEDAWNAITLPFQQAEFLGTKDLFQWVLDRHKPSRKDQYLKLKPKEVVKKGTLYILHATLDHTKWKIAFVTDEGQWKIDAIDGYVRPSEEVSKKDRILASMQNRTARHFDIYYKKDSTAEQDIDKIINERDSGYDEICRFLEREPDIRITLIFFEDMVSKINETGHIGAGMASGTTIVEVYNKKMHLDPFHETTHILANSFGRPPAIFREGFATYMSERLGASPLIEFGGGESSLYERVRELRNNGDWIGLEELLTYTQIGPGWSRPPVAYPEAGAFVKFLIDTYGIEKFLMAYKSLTNSNIKSILEQNEGKLEKIYGLSIGDLEKQWIETLETQNDEPAGSIVSSSP